MKFLALVLFGMATPGWSISQADMVAILSRPAIAERLKGLRLKEAESSFLSGVHVQFSFLYSGGEPAITGIRYREGSLSPTGQLKPKVIFSVHPKEQHFSAELYKFKMGQFSSFAPADVKVTQSPEPGDGDIKIEFLDARRTTRYAQWISASGNKVAAVAYYGEGGGLLFLDTAFENHWREGIGKSEDLFLENLSSELGRRERRGAPRSFSDVGEDREFAKEILSYLLEGRRDNSGGDGRELPKRDGFEAKHD